MSPVKRFGKLLRQYKYEIRQIHAYALFIGMVDLSLPLGIQAIINFLQTGQFTTTWLILVGFVLLGIGITGVLKVLQLRIVENIQQDLFARSAFEFAYRIPRISFLQLDALHAPELANRFFDTLTIQKGLPKILIDFSLAVFQVTFGLALLAVYSPYFILLGLILTVVLWFIFKVTGPKGVVTSLKESKQKYFLAHWLEEIARVNRSFKMLSRDKFHLHKTNDIVEGYLHSRENHFKVLISQFRLFIGFKVVVAAGLLLLGGYLVFQEQMNIGQFVAAEIIIILILNSVEKIIGTIDTIYDVLTALDKIGYVTDLSLDENKGTATLSKETKGVVVEAKEMTFGFSDGNRNVLDKVSFKIDANEKAILAGASGSGKSLLLQILAGVIEVQDGGLYLNGIPYSNYQKEPLQEDIGVTFSANQIFEGTFKENILLGRDINRGRLFEVLRLLGLEDYLMHQPKGIDSLVDSGGRRLSRSVIQKLLIARAIVDEPKLLLLEDPLQFIQEDEKRKIIDYVMDEKREWTVLVISDFHYWEEKADKVIRIDNNNY